MRSLTSSPRTRLFAVGLSLWAAVACATAGDEPEAATDGPDASTVRPPVSEAGSGGDATAFEGGSVFDQASPVPDAALPDGTATPDGGACGPIGVACDPEGSFACGLFAQCDLAGVVPVVLPPDADAGDASSVDASPDAAGDAAGDGAAPVSVGVCLPLPFSAGDCNDGVNACPAGETCLLEARRCLTAAQAACICPSHPGACYP